MSEAHKAVIHRFVQDILNNENFAILSEILHPNYIRRSPTQNIQGLEEFKNVCASYHIAFPDLNIEIDDLIMTDNKAVLTFTFTGTHKGELMGIAATHNSVKVHGIVISQFQQQKIIEQWEIFDQLSMYQQLGLVTLPASMEAPNH